MADAQLGDIVKDKITGFHGIVVAVAHYVNGCNRYAVQSTSLHDGKPLDYEWFDSQLIEFISKSELSVVSTSEKSSKPGGPMPDPQHKM